jgi:hypothetical protein
MVILLTQLGIPVKSIEVPEVLFTADARVNGCDSFAGVIELSGITSPPPKIIPLINTPQS